MDTFAVVKEVTKESSHSLLKEYLKQHEDFSKKLCRPGAEEKYWRLYREFRGEGYYVPITHDDKVDFATLGRFLPELSSKKIWIKKQIEVIKKIKNFSKYKKNVKDLEVILDELVHIKQEVLEADSESEKQKKLDKSKYLFIEFRTKFNILIENLSFLTSYLFPVDHFELREGYDKFKKSETKDGKKRANEIYFYRKIVQDGAQNPNHTGSDSFFRAALDTVYKELQKSYEIIPENLRVDINWILSRIARQIDRGKRKQIGRMEEWYSRVDETLDFYRLLKMNKVKKGNKFLSGEEFVEKLSETRFKLKDYVLTKQKEVFNYWKDKPEKLKAIFVLETILYNEVGGIDNKEGTERMDVAQVVINRLSDGFYSSINPGDSIHPYLTSLPDESLVKNKWLNILLKEGEFSFTYYFITGSVRVFCPEMTRYGRMLRLENIKLSIKALKNSREEFKALRYFSRASMLGRIDMSSIWTDYEPINERPGPAVKSQKTLKKLYQTGKYRFLYEFSLDNGEQYNVIEIKDKLYSYSKEKNYFYKYRSPHLFRYFRKKEI
tara:strand:- start:3465 stop:5117 length:1653 start_codon:yes stop_codon:yes gene_type:complete